MYVVVVTLLAVITTGGGHCAVMETEARQYVVLTAEKTLSLGTSAKLKSTRALTRRHTFSLHLHAGDRTLYLLNEALVVSRAGRRHGLVAQLDVHPVAAVPRVQLNVVDIRG